MSNGKIEKAIAILSTASGLHSIEDARELIEKAERYLRDEPDLVHGLRLSRDMISEAVDRLSMNMPEDGEEASERAKKIHICESALLQIVEYAKSGLAARRLGSQEVAESILAGKGIGPAKAAAVLEKFRLRLEPKGEAYLTDCEGIGENLARRIWESGVVVDGGRVIRPKAPKKSKAKAEAA